MFYSIDHEHIDINTLTDLSVEKILNLSDVTSLFYITKESCKNEGELQKFTELIAL